jgi:type III secretion protein F
MSTAGVSVSSDYISQIGITALNTRETKLRAAIDAVGQKESPSTVDMLDLQQQVQQWSMMIQVVSTLAKEVTDALKGVVQKSS